ncbi:hypothetical protein [Streptomyces sp. NPDC002287]
MSKFPEGNFTIVNNETGRAVRVHLGLVKDGYYTMGIKSLQTLPERTSLNLGAADNTPAAAWYLDTVNGISKITSFAIAEYERIGHHCLWMSTSEDTDSEDADGKVRERTRKTFWNKLNDAPVDLRKKLDPLIPQEWTAIQAQRRASKQALRQFRSEEEHFARVDAEVQAWAEDTEPLSAQQLIVHRAVREGRGGGDGTDPETYDRFQSLVRELDVDVEALVREIESEPRAARVLARVEELLPAVLERRRAEAVASIPAQDIWAWNELCVAVRLDGATAIFANLAVETDEEESDEEEDTGRDTNLNAAVNAYLEEAARGGIVPQPVTTAAQTEMRGNRASRYEGSTYNWTYDGTYIYSSGSQSLPAERTYWTDEDGYLVGKTKGGAGQTWTIKKWTPGTA